MISTLKAYLADILAALLIVALIACGVQTWCLHSTQAARDEAVQQYAVLTGQVQQQNAQAAATLASLTAERNAKQAQIDAAVAAQEKTDAQAQTTIAGLRAQLASQPVRVRYITATGNAGGGGSGAGSQTAASTNAGAADGTEAYGVLPASNSQRLAAVIGEMKTINAAYASCRSVLISNK